MFNRNSLIINGFIIFSLGLIIAAGTLYAERSTLRVKVTQGDSVVPVERPLRAADLPEVGRSPMTVTPGKSTGGRATSVLQYDDNSCEGGFGGFAARFVHDFDVPGQCIQSGLQVVGVTARIFGWSSTNATVFTLHQGGAAPGVPGSGISRAITLPSIGSPFSCPSSPSAMATAALSSPATVTSFGAGANFFAGIMVPQSAYMAMDGNGGATGRAWAEAWGGTAWYTPTSLAGFMNPVHAWMLRVTVEDANCVPVELMSFGVE